MDTSNYYSMFNDRERRVCEMMRRHCALKQIAKELNISLHTVRSHVNKIKRVNSK